jgi:hypothetical protein
MQGMEKVKKKGVCHFSFGALCLLPLMISTSLICLIDVRVYFSSLTFSKFFGLLILQASLMCGKFSITAVDAQQIISYRGPHIFQNLGATSKFLVLEG